jgi:hypothetical protein
MNFLLDALASILDAASWSGPTGIGTRLALPSSPFPSGSSSGTPGEAGRS